MQGMYAIAFFAALRIGEITCQAKQFQRNLINFNQVTFVRNREEEVLAIRITLTHYKHSNPAEPSSQSKPSLPCFGLVGICQCTRYLSWPTFLLA